MTQAFRSWHIIMISLSWTFHICCGVYPTQYEPTAVSDFRCRCANTVLQYNIWPLCSIFFYRKKDRNNKKYFRIVFRTALRLHWDMYGKSLLER